MDSLFPIVSIVAVISFAVAGYALGRLHGALKYSEALENLMTHGTPGAAPKGHTIYPETAERALDRDAKAIEREYTKATIAQGVAELKALYVSEGVPVPSDKDLQAEVKDMLGRSGTSEAGVG